MVSLSSCVIGDAHFRALASNSRSYPLLTFKCVSLCDHRKKEICYLRRGRSQYLEIHSVLAFFCGNVNKSTCRGWKNTAMANKADAVSSQGPSSLWRTETRPYITQSWCKCLLEMRRSSRSSALVCFWSDFDGNYPPLNSKISHFTFTPAGNMTARSQRELSFPRHKHLRLTLCHQTSFTLWDQTRHLIVPHHITPELGCELIICSIVRLSLVDFFPL